MVDSFNGIEILYLKIFEIMLIRVLQPYLSSSILKNINHNNDKYSKYGETKFIIPTKAVQQGLRNSCAICPDSITYNVGKFGWIYLV